MSEPRETRPTGPPAAADAGVLELLRNPATSAGVLHGVGRDPEKTSSYEVKKGLVLHPRTPLVVSRTLLGHLFWMDVCQVCNQPAAHPVVRRQAERMLARRVVDLGVGERKALARRAPRGVVSALLKDEDEDVLVALLGNERLLEQEAAAIAEREELSPAMLDRLAGHIRWSRSRDVRVAVTRNPRTPISTALRLLAAAAPGDLRGLSEDVKVRRIVRVGARRLLEQGRNGRS
ncbi:MAG: hypothetical protein GY716_21485 [bacterium]|nr:hypothetical protein [bacterium]